MWLAQGAGCGWKERLAEITTVLESEWRVPTPAGVLVGGTILFEDASAKVS